MSNLFQYLDESPTVFYQMKKNQNWDLEFVSENVKNIFGVSAEEIVSTQKDFTEFIHEEDIGNFLQQSHNLTVKHHTQYNFEPYRIINGRGVRWISHVTKIVRNKEGNSNFIYGYLTDITRHKELYSQLKVTKNIIETIFNHSTHFIELLSPDGKLLQANKTALSFAGASEYEVVGKYFWQTPWWKHCEKEQKKLRKEIARCALGEKIRKKKSQVNFKNELFYIDFSLEPVFNENNEVIYILAEGQDITQSVHNQRKINEYIDIINDNVMITTTNKEGIILECSKAFCKLTGYKKSEIVGNTHKMFKHPSTSRHFYKDMWDHLKEGKVFKAEYQNSTKNGGSIWVENVITPNFDECHNITGYTSVFNDITDKKEISELLILDYLTKLYNRRYFNTVFETELKRSRRHGYSFVLIIIDIDYFKQYNDTYGHHQGDIALQKVAQALQKSVSRPEDYVFRLGGEEFGIITSDIDDDGAFALAQKCKENVEKLDIEHKGSKEFGKITISLGIKISDAKSSECENVIYKESDEALYRAKHQGRNQICV